MSTLLLILPDQLSKNNEVLDFLKDDNLLLLYEPHDSFYEISHHKHKLVFQISSFRHFINSINYKNIIHEKISKKPLKLTKYLSALHKESPFSSLYVSKPSEYSTLKDLMYFCQLNNIDLKVFEDKKFITTDEDYKYWAKD